MEEPIPTPNPSRMQRLARMLQGHPYEVVLGLGLFAFFLYKLRDLSLPYFWDELGVYGRAAVYLHDHTLGLLPANLPPELSRGHPLLLVFVVASLFRVFGASTTVAHVFMFLLAVSLLISVFWIARAHWNAKVGLAASALLAVQPLFMAQSTLLLPELPLALACLWAIDTFASRRYWLGGICLALAIFIKETALVLGLVLGVMMLADWIRSRPSWKAALWGFLALLVPGLLYGLFLLMQKRQNGWYFFPLHENHMDFHWPAMKGKLIDYCNFIFIEQGRYTLSVIVGLWATFRLFGRRDGRRFSLGIGWTFALFAVVLILFSSGNAILAARAVFELVRDQARALFPVVALLSVVHLNQLTSPGFNYDYDMSFRYPVSLQRQATRYVEMTIGVDKPIYTIFPPIFGLEDPRYGYAHKKFTRYNFIYFPQAEYVFVSEVFNRFVPPPGVRLELIKDFISPYMRIYLFRILR
jgi:hypothetical protein